MVNSLEKQQEVVSDIQFILNEEISTGNKLYLIEYIITAVDWDEWKVF